MPVYHQRSFDPSLPYPALVKDCDLLMVALLGQYGAIQAYLDQWFLLGTDSEFRALAWSPGVLGFFNYGRVGVRDGSTLSFTAQGSAPYAESALVVPTLLVRQVTVLGVPYVQLVALPFDMAYIFANNLLSVVTTRDVWGYSKTQGSITTGSTSACAEIHRVRAEVLDPLGPTQTWQSRQLYALRRAAGLPPMLPSLSPGTPMPALSPLAPPFTNGLGEVRIAVDHAGGHVWVDDPTDPVDPALIARLPAVGLGEVVGPLGPEPAPPFFDPGPVPGLPGDTADADLRRRLSAGAVAGVALFVTPFSSVLPDIPVRVLGLKQERTCWNPQEAEHRRLTLGTLRAVDAWPTAVEGPGTWSFVRTRSPASHPYSADLGLQTQSTLGAVRMQTHMIVEAGVELWST